MPDRTPIGPQPCARPPPRPSSAAAPAVTTRSRRASVARSSLRGTTMSTNPCSSRNSDVWNPSGSSSPTVPLATRAPANPIRARGSATITSPRLAKLASTPPVVGSVSTLMNGTPAMSIRVSGAVVLASCSSESVPSCMRAPPEAADHDGRDPLVQRRLEAARDLLTDHAAHAAAHEAEVEQADRHGVALDPPVPHTAASRRPVLMAAPPADRDMASGRGSPADRRT